MKEKITSILVLAVLSISILAFANIAVAAPPVLPQFAWINPAYMGADPYFGTSSNVVGYREGIGWNFTLGWTNWYAAPINITAIRVYFTWGANYTYRFAPIKIDPGQTRIFKVGNITASVAEASEFWTHSYSIYIHHVNSTTAPYGEVTTPSPFAPASPIWIHYGSNFIVLSADHLDCLSLWAKLEADLGSGTVTTMMVPTPTQPAATKFYVLMQQASLEFNMGLQLLETGIFSTAKTHLQNADGLYTQALTEWDQRGTALEDAEVNNTRSDTSLNLATATAAVVNAYGWLLFGLGWTFIGIGVIIYGWKKPKASPPPS
jgi:hypothetical protein